MTRQDSMESISMPIIQDSGGSIVGSVIKFGDYDWCVLDVQNGKALLLCDKIIDVRAYHSVAADITWAECELRGYLNGVFLDSFSANDKSRIAEAAVVTSNNPWYGTNGGKTTKDRLFLLSIEEVVQYFGDSGRLADGLPEDDDSIGFIDDRYSSSRVALTKAAMIRAGGCGHLVSIVHMPPLSMKKAKSVYTAPILTMSLLLVPAYAPLCG